MLAGDGAPRTVTGVPNHSPDLTPSPAAVPGAGEGDGRVRAHPGDVAAMFAGWLYAEDRRAQGRYAGAGTDTLGVRRGRCGALVTAPHAVAHWRDGARKPADMGTGFLADVLAQLLDADVVVAEGEQSRDGNYDPDGVFKAALAGFTPRLVLDVHGMADRHGPDVCLGLGGLPRAAEPLAEVFAGALRSAGFVVSVNVPFAATGDHTVTSTFQRRGIAALQLEVAARNRRPHGDLVTVMRLAESLAGAARACLATAGALR